LISLGEQYAPIQMFSTTLGLTEISIEMVLEIFHKFPLDKIGYHVEGKRDGSWILVETRVCIWVYFFSTKGRKEDR
jgi:hypothetical protein